MKFSSNLLLILILQLSTNLWFFTDPLVFDYTRNPQKQQPLKLVDEGITVNIIEFTKSKRGIPLVLVNGHLFHRKSISNKNIRWACTLQKQHRCPAKIMQNVSTEQFDMSMIPLHTHSLNRKIKKEK